MIAQATAVQLFEAGMLVCFGASWPVSILKSLRTRHVAGKSLGFMVLVLVGYLLGLTGKLLYAHALGELPQPVSILYALNALLVAVDIALYARYRNMDANAASVGT